MFESHWSESQRYVAPENDEGDLGARECCYREVPNLEQDRSANISLAKTFFAPPKSPTFLRCRSFSSSRQLKNQPLDALDGK